METYLFATDFSQNAKHALNFAIPFVKKQKGELFLFHAYDYVDPIVGVPVSYAEDLNKEKEVSVQKKLASWKELVEKIEPGLPCRYIARRVPFTQSLLSLAKEVEAKAIIMGTKGASGLKKVLVGSNTASLISKADCPVYAIPEESAYAGIKSIVYATDYQEENEAILDQVNHIASTFDAKVEILYVVLDNSKVDLGIYEWYQKAVKEKLPGIDVSFSTINHSSVIGGISKYTKRTRPDLVIMAMYKKSWVQKLLNGSFTRKQVLQAQIPLLVLPAEVEEKITV